jgi:tetratricopeptide (TPR) repeat protein
MRRKRKAKKPTDRREVRQGKPKVPFGRRLSADGLALLMVMALAAALRIGYTLASRKSPFFDHLDLDSRFYDLWAKEIASGDWVGDDVFFMGPLYPYFLAVVYKVAGPSLLLVKLVQAVLGSLTAGMTYLLGKRCFGTTAGLVAGFVAALYVPFIFYDTSILFPVLATLLNTTALYFLYRGVCAGDDKSFLVGGLFAGLSAAGNASILAFGPLAVVFLFVYGKIPLARRLRRVVLFVVGVAVVVTPITVRNGVVGGDFVPLTSNAGLNLFIGNNEKSTGAYVKPDGLDVYTDPSGRSIAEAALGRDLKPSEVSGYWRGRAVEFVRANPARSASNLVRKAFLFWSVYEIPQIEHLPFEKRYSWLLRIPSPTYGIVCPLGLLGMLLALRKRKHAWLLFLFVISYSATIVAFFVVARYRLPMVPALMIFAGYTVYWWISAYGRGDWRRLALSIGGFVVLFLLVHVNFYRIDPLSGYAQSYYRLGIIKEEMGEAAGALSDYARATDLDPSLVPAHLNAGILLSRLGRYDEARAELQRAVSLDADYAKAYYNLGLVYAEQAMNDSALAMMTRAVALEEDYDLAMLGQASIYYEMADFERAESLLVSLRGRLSMSEQSQRQINMLLRAIPERTGWIARRRSEPQRISDAHLLRGDNLLSLGMTDRALKAYLAAVASDSLSAVAHYQAGTIYFNMGDFVSAMTHFDRVLSAVPSYKGAHFAIGVIAFRRGDIQGACSEFEQELVVDPRSSASHINLAMCYEEHLKDLRRAAYHISKYIELTGGSQELRDHLRELREHIGGETGNEIE